MFKMDCLGLFGRNVLTLQPNLVDDLLRHVYTSILTKLTRIEMERSYFIASHTIEEKKVGRLLNEYKAEF